MAFHPDITPRSREDTAVGLAQLALSKAKKQQTRKSGSATWHNEDGTRTVIGPDAGSSGIAPWVGDTTPPGMPTGIGVDSAAGMILVTWNGTLQDGVPADFDHIQILVDGAEAGQLRVRGTATLGPYEAGSVHQVTVRSWDDAHAEDGSPAPNGSDPTGPVSVTVKSVVDTEQIKDAQDKAQAAINAAVMAETTASSARDTAAAAKTIAGGKNRIIAAASEPAHDGLALGDLWMQLDQSNNVVGIQLWNGEAFIDYVLMAQKVLVAGSVGTICLADGAITTDKITASEALLEKLLVRKIKADEIDVGLLTTAIVESKLFKTPDGLVGFDESGYWAKGKDGGYIFQVSRDGVQATGGFQTASKGDRVQLTQTQIKGAVTGCLQGIGDNEELPYWIILGSHGMTGDEMRMGTNSTNPQFYASENSDRHSYAGMYAEDVAIDVDHALWINRYPCTPHINVPLDQWIDFYPGFEDYVQRSRLDIAGGMCYMTVAVQGSLPDNQYTQIAKAKTVYPPLGQNAVCTLQYAYAAGAFIGSNTDPEPQVIQIMNHSGGPRTWAVAQFIFPYKGQLD